MTKQPQQDQTIPRYESLPGQLLLFGPPQTKPTNCCPHCRQLYIPQTKKQAMDACPKCQRRIYPN